MHICPCSRTVGISKKIWIRIYFGPVTVDSEEVFRHFAFWRHGSRLATFFIAPKNCIFWGASFELNKNLVTLDPEKLQGIHGTPLYHCYSLPHTLFCLICTINSEMKSFLIFTQLSKPGMVSAGFLWTRWIPRSFSCRMAWPLTWHWVQAFRAEWHGHWHDTEFKLFVQNGMAIDMTLSSSIHL